MSILLIVIALFIIVFFDFKVQYLVTFRVTWSSRKIEIMANIYIVPINFVYICRDL